MPLSLLERLTGTRYRNSGFLSSAGIHRRLQWRPLAGRRTYGVTVPSKPYTTVPLVVVGKVEASSLRVDGLGTWNDLFGFPLTTANWLIRIVEPDEIDLQPQFHTARQVIQDLQERASIYYHGLDHTVTTYYDNDMPGICLESPLLEVRRSLYVANVIHSDLEETERRWNVPEDSMLAWKDVMCTHSIRPLDVSRNGFPIGPSDYRSALSDALVEAHFSLTLHAGEPAVFNARIQKIIIWDE